MLSWIIYVRCPILKFPSSPLSDSLVAVAGPNRPPLPKPPPPPKKPLMTWGDPPDEPVKPVATAATSAPKRTAVAKQKAAGRVAGERQDV